MAMAVPSLSPWSRQHQHCAEHRTDRQCPCRAAPSCRQRGRLPVLPEEPAFGLRQHAIQWGMDKSWKEVKWNNIAPKLQSRGKSCMYSLIKKKKKDWVGEARKEVWFRCFDLQPARCPGSLLNATSHTRLLSSLTAVFYHCIDLYALMLPDLCWLPLILAPSILRALPNTAIIPSSVQV